MDRSARHDALPLADGAFVELAARSAFSLLDGASTPEGLAARAAELGMPALALTDVFDLGGAVRFARACRKEGIRPLVGGEVVLSVRRRLVLLARDREGYGNLSSLITTARRARPRGEPRLDPEELRGRAAGLVALVKAGVADPVEGWTRSELRDLRALFSGRLHLALEHHGLPEDARRVEGWLRVAEEEGLSWVPVNAPRYARPSDRLVHDVLTCLRHDRTLDEAGDVLLPNGEWYLKSGDQMALRWCERRRAEARAASTRAASGSASPTRFTGSAPSGRCGCRGCEALRRTVRIARACRFRIDELSPPLPSFPAPGGRSSASFLRALVEAGARERYGEDFGPEHGRQIDHELGIIGRLELEDYFLIVWDIVRFARRRGILVQGRGSAANSAVCYCLGITAVDPVGMDLLFERFLSEERGEAPDIDLDIAHREREEVLQYVYDTYGRDHAAMVCESITYRGRLAVRDAARVLGFSPEEADRLSAEVERGEAADAARRLAEGGARRAGLDPGERRVRALLRVVRGLDRLPRHRSIHVGGFVLSSRPVGEVVPVEDASMEGRTVIQWDKDDLGRSGIIKFDLLGLGILTVLGEALGAVRRTRGRVLDLAGIPAGDPGVYDMICEADTVGVFQIESRAQMNTLPRVRPRCFYDLVVEIALIRPGPIQGDMVHPYLRRRQGREPVTYLDPRLEPLLERTLGVPLFQEQGMKVAVTLAGFTPAQADRLRRAMGFKRSREAMEEVGRELEEGLKANGVAPEAREKIFRQLTGFANYGFPESHAASFALLVYASAWLKHHFAPEFHCAILNAQPMGFYAPSTLVEDARRHGVEVRPVDLLHSAWDSTLERTGTAAPPTSDSAPAPALRLGLRLVRGLGGRSRDRLREARADGPFSSVEDVVRRSGLGASELRTLAEAGAFRSLWPGRREALWELLRQLRGDAGPLAPRAEPARMEPARKATARTEPAQGGPEADVLSPVGRSGRFPPLSRAQRVAADYRTTGLSTEGHPMEFLRDELRRRGVLSAEELSARPAGEEVAVAGIAICRQRPSTAKGVMFVTLEDETGFANFVVLHEVQERFRRELRDPVLLLEGEVEREGDVINVLTSRVRSLAPRHGTEGLPERNFR
ncbi:MAG: DNA polymerase III subunit alpha [Acidobacteriota bacterium]